MIKIRKAEIADRDKILKLLRETPELQGSRHRVDAEYTKTYVSNCILDTKENCVMVAEENGKIAGLITLEVCPKKKLSHLTDIVVVNGQRRKKIGSLLYEHCENILKKRGITTVAGITQSDNKKMHKFCAKHGLGLGKKMYYFEKKLK